MRRLIAARVIRRSGGSGSAPALVSVRPPAEWAPAAWSAGRRQGLHNAASLSGRSPLRAGEQQISGRRAASTNGFSGRRAASTNRGRRQLVDAELRPQTDEPDPFVDAELRPQIAGSGRRAASTNRADYGGAAEGLTTSLSLPLSPTSLPMKEDATTREEREREKIRGGDAEVPAGDAEVLAAVRAATGSSVWGRPLVELRALVESAGAPAVLAAIRRGGLPATVVGLVAALPDALRAGPSQAARSTPSVEETQAMLTEQASRPLPDPADARALLEDLRARMPGHERLTDRDRVTPRPPTL
jgi:hypothetical protein